MPLPTSVSNGQINPNLRIQEQNPAATGSSILLLNEAFRQGLVSADEIRDRLTNRPIREQVEREAGKDALKQIEIAPARRAQDMSAADQMSKLRDLQISAQTQAIADEPMDKVSARKLQDLHIKHAQQQLDYEPDKHKADLAYREAQVAIANTKAHPPGESLYSQQLSKGTIEDIDKTIAKVDTFSPGTLAATGRAISSKVPGTEMKDFAANLESLKAKIGFSQLQEMRDASRTGGALGSLAVKESEWLQNSISALDPSMSPAALKTNLQTIRDRLVRWEEAKKAAMPGTTPAKGASPTLPLTSLAPTGATGAPEVGLDEYNALPEGAPYRAPGDPEGKIRYKTSPGGQTAPKTAPVAALQPFQPIQPATRNVVNRLQ